MNEVNKVRWGQVSSPADVVYYILKQTVSPTLRNVDVRDIRILEPACGDGQFLLPLYDMLNKAYQKRGYTQANAAEYILNRNLYGIDIDPAAVAKARQALEMRTGLSPVGVCCGDTLHKGYQPSDIPLLDNYFDVVIGNPPYVTWEIDRQARNYYRQHYKTALTGKINLYRLFIERAVGLLKKGGYLGYICPNTYLTDNDSRLLRQMLLEHMHIIEIVHVPENVKIFPGVTQATTILIAQKKIQLSQRHCIKIKSIDEGAKVFTSKEIIRIPQWYWREKTGGTFRILPEWYKDIADRLCRAQSLGDFAKIYQGEVNLTVHKGDLQSKASKTNFPLLRGRHIIPYGFLPQDAWGSFSYIEPSPAIRDHAQHRRVVLQQVSNMTQQLRLKCGLLEPESPVYCANSTNYILVPDQDQVTYRYLMALCHSTLWNLLFNWGSNTNHITVRELAALPLPDCTDAAKGYLAGLVERILHSRELPMKQELERRIDQEIFRLFKFDSHLAELITNYGQKYRKRLALF